MEAAKIDVSFFLPSHTNDQLPINVPPLRTICCSPCMNALKPFPLLLIRNVFPKRCGANQMVLVPRLTIDRQRGLMLVGYDIQLRLLESCREVVDPTVRRRRRDGEVNICFFCRRRSRDVTDLTFGKHLCMQAVNCVLASSLSLAVSGKWLSQSRSTHCRCPPGSRILQIKKQISFSISLKREEQ